MGLLTTTAGSFPKPRALVRARRLFREEQIDAAAFGEQESRAVQQAIALQEKLGLSILTDGEMTRGDMVAHYAGRLEGLEEGMLVRCWGNRYVRRPRITGAVGRTGPILIDAWRQAQGLTEKPLRAIVTGPYTLMHWSFDEHYGSRRTCAADFCAAVADEVGELAAAGATEIQLDEPAFGAVAEELGWATDLAGKIAERKGGARLWARVGFGDPDPDWRALAALPVDCLMIGLAHQELEPPSSWPHGRMLAAGVVDTIDPQPESVDAVRGRIEKLLAGIPEDRLIVTADAGMRGLATDAAEAKTRALVEAAAAF